LGVLVLSKDFGGQANYTDLIENYPGIDEIGGHELVESIRSQAEKWSVKTMMVEAEKVRQVADGFVVTAFGKQYKSRAVVLAFGKTPRDLGVIGENELKGKGVSYCYICDAPLYKNKSVAVAGFGDLGLEAILACSKVAKKVFALSKTDKLSGHAMLLKAVSKRKNVVLLPNTKILSLKGKERLETIELSDIQTGSKTFLNVDGLFVELGHIAQSDFVRDLVQLDQSGQVVVKDDQSTSCPGVFAAGDATNRPYKQATISAGEGAAAALAVFDWIMRQRGGEGMSSDWTQIKKIK
jgi:thioredoxin reductase (NADPH)